MLLLVKADPPSTMDLLSTSFWTLCRMSIWTKLVTDVVVLLQAPPTSTWSELATTGPTAFLFSTAHDTVELMEGIILLASLWRLDLSVCVVSYVNLVGKKLISRIDVCMCRGARGNRKAYKLCPRRTIWIENALLPASFPRCSSHRP